MAKVAKIPVIDISAEGGDQAQVARDLVEAAVEHGFIYIKSTGKDIPVDAIVNAFNLVYIPTLPLYIPLPLDLVVDIGQSPGSSSTRPHWRRSNDARYSKIIGAGPACTMRP